MKFINLYLLSSLFFVFAACKKSGNDNPAELSAESKFNVSYGADAKQTYDYYLPAGRSSAATKAIIMIHGGAWIQGDKSEFTAFVDTLKRRLPGYAIFNLNYRLGDQASNSNGFPTQELDVKAAVDQIYAMRSTYQISDQFVTLGASAGAHLAMLQAYKYPTPAIKTVVNFFGPTDMADMYNNPASVFVSPQNIALLLGGTPTSNPQMYFNSSPVNFVKAGSAPTISFQGGTDVLVRPSQQTSLHSKLQANAVANQYVFYPTEGHGWAGANLTDSFDKLVAFIKTHNP